MVLSSLVLIGVTATDQWIGPSITTSAELGYPEPQYVQYDTDNLTDEQLMLLGRRQARMIETRSGRLGVIEPGKRGLILIPDNQDLRVVTYSIRGLR